MSIAMDHDIKRWPAKRKSALVLDIIQGKTTVAEASRTCDLSPSEIEEWVDDGLVFTSRNYTALIRSYGLRQAFIATHRSQQNGMIERVIRTLKEQCTQRQRFESIQHASRVIGEWLRCNG